MKKEMNKRGLSDVVTTVLIILFAIVAVAVVGGIVMNQINKAGKNIDKASFCTENIVEPVTCVNSSDVSINVGFTRTQGDATLSTVRANVELPSGAVLTASATKNTAKGASDTMTVTKVAADKQRSVEIAATYTYMGAETVTCISKKLDCTVA